MAEKLKQNEQIFPTPEAPDVLLPEAKDAEHLREGEQDPAKALEQARADVQETVQAESQPNPLERLQDSGEAPEPMSPKRINQELRKVTKQQQIKQVQRQLPAPQRALSKIIHQPAIRAVSEVAGKTISRPTGLLGGGIVSLLGTSSYLYLAKHIGFTYNYLIFLLLFVGGFIIGLALELLIHTVTSSNRHGDH